MAEELESIRERAALIHETLTDLRADFARTRLFLLAPGLADEIEINHMDEHALLALHRRAWWWVAAFALAAGALASYLLGDSVLQFSTIIGAYLFAMGVGSWLSRFFERQLPAHFLRIELLVAENHRHQLRMRIADGRMIVSDRPGLGVTLSDQLRAWTTDTFEVGDRVAAS